MPAVLLFQPRGKKHEDSVPYAMSGTAVLHFKRYYKIYIRIYKKPITK